MTSRMRAEFVLLGVTLAWGGSFLVVKNTLATLPPFSLIALRFALAAAVLALAFRGNAFALGQDASGRSRWRTAAWIGALLWAAFAFQTAGLVYTTPARSGFITATDVAFVQMAVVAGLSLPLALAFESAPRTLDLPGIAAIAYLGVICSAAGFLGQTWGQRHTTPIRVGLIFSLESLFAALLSVAVGAESLTPWQWLGGLMLVGGVVIGELPEDAAPQPARVD